MPDSLLFEATFSLFVCFVVFGFTTHSCAHCPITPSCAFVSVGFVVSHRGGARGSLLVCVLDSHLTGISAPRACCPGSYNDSGHQVMCFPYFVLLALERVTCTVTECHAAVSEFPACTGSRETEQRISGTARDVGGQDNFTWGHRASTAVGHSLHT